MPPTPSNAPAGSSTLASTSDADQRRRRAQLRILTLTLLAHTTLASAVSLLSNGRSTALVNSTGSIAMSDSGRQVAALFPHLTLLVSAFIVLSNLKRPHGSQSGLAFLLCGTGLLWLAPTLINGSSAPLATPLILGAIIIAVWSMGIRLRDLVVFGQIGVGIAVASLTLGILSDHAWMGSTTETKAIIGERMLSGFFPQMNVLGMSLALTFPFVGYFQKRRHRIMGGIIIVTALTLSASRTSIFSIAAIAAGWLVLWTLSRSARTGLVGMFTATAVIIAAAVPFLRFPDDALSGRGLLWRITLTLLKDDLGKGIGFDAFVPNGPVYRHTLNTYWHAHNTSLTFVAILGVSGIAILAAFWFPAWRTSITSARASMIPSFSLGALAIVGAAEATLRPNEFDGVAWISWISLFALGLAIESAAPPVAESLTTPSDTSLPVDTIDAFAQRGTWNAVPSDSHRTRSRVSSTS